MPATANDARWLAAAARLAGRARPLSRPNPAVGAIIVRDGIMVGRGWTHAGGRPHAEAIALDQAGAAAVGATLFVTLEPCAHRSERGPACADLVARAGLARVVVGQRDPDPRTAGEGAARIAAAGIAVSVLDDAPSRTSLAGYLMRRQHGRPFVTLKLAISADGCISRADGGEQWITGEAARAHVHARRAWQDAILVGGGTWRRDRPRLDVRLPGLEDRSPARFVLTSGPAPAGTTAIATPAAIVDLAQVQYLYVEGGAQTATAFLEAGLVDRLDLYRAPLAIGPGLAAPLQLAPAALDAPGSGWSLVEQCQLGSDCFTAYQRTGLRE